MKHFTRTVLLGALVTTPAVAGIADSPLPVLVAGKKTFHVYSVPSVVAYGGLGTYFGCTSTDTAPIQVGIEVFGSGGGAPANDAAATSLAVSPGAGVMFGTGGAAGIVIDPNLGGSFTATARILSTSKKLACTAFVADRSNAPPSVAWQLTIIKKTTQKGE
jgi:hypothetical protein